MLRTFWLSFLLQSTGHFINPGQLEPLEINAWSWLKVLLCKANKCCLGFIQGNTVGILSCTWLGYVDHLIHFSVISDYVLVPTPYYGGFDLAICRRAKVKIYPVDCSSDNDYMPTIKLLEDTLTKARNEVHMLQWFIGRNIGM